MTSDSAAVGMSGVTNEPTSAPGTSAASRHQSESRSAASLRWAATAADGAAEDEARQRECHRLVNVAAEQVLQSERREQDPAYPDHPRSRT